MYNLVTHFIKDSENISDQINELATGEPIFIIFDDMINSKSLPYIAKLFTVDGRHMNISIAFLTQRMFVNNEYFRQISQNCDNFCVFKNPRNSSEIRSLAQQMTPGNLILVQIYMEATKGPFSYLFINLTQECDPKLKYLSNLFDNDGFVNIYIVDVRRFKKTKMRNNRGIIHFMNENMPKLKHFQPHQQATMLDNSNNFIKKFIQQMQKQHFKNTFNPFI